MALRLAGRLNVMVAIAFSMLTWTVLVSDIATPLL
jgi:hypothetical protein